VCRARVTLALRRRRRFFPQFLYRHEQPPAVSGRRSLNPDPLLPCRPRVKGTRRRKKLRIRQRRHIIIISRHVLYSCVYIYIYIHVYSIHVIAAILYYILNKQVAHYNCSDSSGGGNSSSSSSSSGSLLTVGSYGPAFSHTVNVYRYCTHATPRVHARTTGKKEYICSHIGEGASSRTYTHG